MFMMQQLTAEAMGGQEGRVLQTVIDRDFNMKPVEELACSEAGLAYVSMYLRRASTHHGASEQRCLMDSEELQAAPCPSL